MKRTETPSANRDPSYAPVDVQHPFEEGDEARGTRPAHLPMRQPPASACNTGPEPRLTPGHYSPRSGASGHHFAGPSPQVTPEKRDQLGHRSHAPATFFKVRIASLFEARRRLFVSAITRLTGSTRTSSRIPARRGPRPTSLAPGGPPAVHGRVAPGVQASRLRACRPAHVFPTAPTHRLSPACTNDGLTRAMQQPRPGKCPAQGAKVGGPREGPVTVTCAH